MKNLKNSVKKSITAAVKTMKKSIKDTLKANGVRITTISHWREFNETDFKNYDTLKAATDTDETFDMDTAVEEIVNGAEFYIVSKQDFAEAESNYQRAKLEWENKKRAKSAGKSYKINKLQNEIAKLSRELQTLRGE